MTDQQPKLGQPELATEMLSASRPVRWPEGRERTSAEAIQAGLGFLDCHWPDSSPGGQGTLWLTSSVLARLAEMSPEHIGYSLRRKIKTSLDWLMCVWSPEGAWGNDCACTAWAVLALRGLGLTVPGAAMDFLQRCRRPDGGFAAIAASGTGAQRNSVPAVTALAVRALGDEQVDWAAEQFLAAYLQAVDSGSATGSARAMRFHVCAEILDWHEGLASTSLLNLVRQVVSDIGNDGALDRALQLRCFRRLRMQRAWPLAADLRAMQMEDGSWPEREEHKIFTTVTAVSALVLGESQPGLYFGSDLPLPRRLQQW